MKGTKPDAGSLLGQGGKLVAERWGLEFREAHTLSIDPAALEILDREASRRLGVLPLEFGPDGPVFAVAEPSEERFAAVRDLAGDNATFVVVATETLDALLNSKVFSVPNSPRRPALFRGRSEPNLAHLAALPSGAAGIEATATEPERSPEEGPVEEPTAVPAEHAAGDPAEPAPAASPDSAQSTNALDTLLTQIRTGAGSLRAQVEHLTESLEATQRELREANAQLAEANRVAEGHDEVVSGLRNEIGGLRSEIESLGEKLAGSSSLNESMTARLEEVARELMEPSSGEAAG